MKPKRLTFEILMDAYTEALAEIVRLRAMKKQQKRKLKGPVGLGRAAFEGHQKSMFPKSKYPWRNLKWADIPDYEQCAFVAAAQAAIEEWQRPLKGNGKKPVT